MRLDDNNLIFKNRYRIGQFFVRCAAFKVAPSSNTVIGALARVTYVVEFLAGWTCDDRTFNCVRVWVLPGFRNARSRGTINCATLVITNALVAFIRVSCVRFTLLLSYHFNRWSLSRGYFRQAQPVSARCRQSVSTAVTVVTIVSEHWIWLANFDVWKD